MPGTSGMCRAKLIARELLPKENKSLHNRFLEAPRHLREAGTPSCRFSFTPRLSLISQYTPNKNQTQ
jgi:hypothetical protein